jgi:hypothetical protein
MGAPARPPHPPQPSDEHLALVNELLRSIAESETRAQQAYRLGLASATACQHGVEPTRELFTLAMSAATMHQCVDCIAAWIAESMALKYGART